MVSPGELLSSDAVKNLLSGFLGAIVGAVVGGWATYRASISLEERKHHDTNLQIYAVLISEISGHQSSLARTVDYVLPAWLLRGEEDARGNQDLQLRRLNMPRPTLDVYYYTTFIAELIFSDLFVFISNYYRAIQSLNGYAAELGKPQKEEDDILLRRRYVEQCRDVLRASIEAMTELVHAPGSKRYSKRLHWIVENFQQTKSRYELLIALTQVKYWQLDHLRLGIGGDGLLREIPAEIKNDSTQSWLSFLEAARAIRGS